MSNPAGSGGQRGDERAISEVVTPEDPTAEPSHRVGATQGPGCQGAWVAPRSYCNYRASVAAVAGRELSLHNLRVFFTTSFGFRSVLPPQKKLVLVLNNLRVRLVSRA